MVKSIIKIFFSLIVAIGLVMPAHAFSFNFGAIVGGLKSELYNNKYGLALAGVLGAGWVAYYLYTEKLRNDVHYYELCNQIQEDIIVKESLKKDRKIYLLQQELDEKQEELRDASYEMERQSQELGRGWTAVEQERSKLTEQSEQAAMSMADKEHELLVREEEVKNQLQKHELFKQERKQYKATEKAKDLLHKENNKEGMSYYRMMEKKGQQIIAREDALDEKEQAWREKMELAQERITKLRTEIETLKSELANTQDKLSEYESNKHEKHLRTMDNFSS